MFKNLIASQTNLSRRSVLQLAFGMLLTLIPVTARSQTSSATDGSTPLGLSPGAPAGSYALSGFDNINPYNGNLNFRLPLYAIEGRGAAQTVSMLAIDAKSWYVKHRPIADGESLDSPTYNWWAPKPGYGPGSLVGRHSGDGTWICSGNGRRYMQTLTRLTFTTADGTEYEFRDQLTGGQPATLSSPCTTNPTPSRGTVFVTADGTAATFISDTIIYDTAGIGTERTSLFYPSGYLMLRDGTRFRIDGGNITWLRDRNGNRVSFTYDSSNHILTITDSLNRQVTFSYDTYTDQVSFKGFGGTTRTITINRSFGSSALRTTNPRNEPASRYQIQTYRGLFPLLNNASSSTYFNAGGVTSVILPDGRQYQFFYNCYGELARVNLPTGGAIEYDYTADSGGNSDYIYRRVIERRVYPDGVNLEGYTTFSNIIYGVGTVDQFNSTGTLLSRTKHYFYGSPENSFYASGISYPAKFEGREYKTERYAADGATLLRSEQMTWANRAPISWSWNQCCLDEPPNDPRVTDTTTTLADVSPNLVSKHVFGYDDSLPYNNQNNVKEYDFGSGSPGSLVRETRSTYITSSTYTDAATGAHLRSLPSQVSIYDAGGVERARTTYEYDNYTADANHAGLIDRAGISGFDSAFSTSYTARGNVTGSTHYLLTNGSVTGSVSSYAQYDIAGNVVKAIDARGYATNFDFTDRFGAPDGEATGNTSPTELSSVGQASYAFTTLVTNAANYTVYSQFDYYLGRPVNAQDANGIVFAGSYNDALDRPTQVIRDYNNVSAKSQTTFSYDDPGRSIITTSDQASYADNALKGQMVYDGLGRTIETRQYEGGSNYIAVQTQYDAAGRAYKTSNPFRPWNSESAVWTTTGLDALGRVISVTTPDSAVVTTAYSSNTVTVTDQAGKARKSVSDALGRLASVYEDPNSSNYQTSHTYDVLDDLTQVSQGSQTRTFVYDSLKRLTSAANPESGTVSYQYDNNGNLTQKTDARAVVTTFGTYDALNRPTTKSYSDGTPTVTYNYDTATNGKGRVASVSSSISTTNYTAYNALGGLTSSNQVTDGQTYSISYAYNLAGSRTSLTYPSGRVITSEYDAANRLAGVRDQSSGIYYAGATATDATNRIQYAAQGAVSVMKLGNGLWEHTNFNNRLQATQIGLGTSSTDSSTLGLSYNYGTTNNNGNLQSVSYSGGGLSYSQSFGYDSLNRLTTSSESGSWSQTNAYDRYGNRWIDLGGGNQSLYFNTANNRITNSGYSYDSAGNLTSDGLHTYAFDAENRIKTVDGATDVYRYDGDGNRVRKNFTSGEKLRMVYSAGLIAEYDLANGSLKKEYIYGAKGLVATIEPTNGTQYTTSDHLGSPRVVTNSSAGVVSRHDYMPFGEEVGVGVGGRTSGMGYGGADGQRQKFTSKERDIEIGLDYFGARCYGSIQGRFTSADPLLSSGTIYNPQSWNRYSYTSNNPLKYIDPTGLYDWSNELGGSASDNDLLNKANAIQDEKKRRTAVSQANHIIGLRNLFRNALAGAAAAARNGNLTASQQAAITRAVNAYGTEGDGNKVIVGFGRQGTGVGATTEGTSLSDEIYVNFNAGHHGNDLIIDVAHEGSHVADNQDFNATHSGGIYDYGGPTDISEYETERRAYQVSSSVAQMVGKRSYPNNLENQPRLEVWNSGWRAADRETKRAAGIDRLINTYYDVSRTKPGQSLGQIKVNVP